MEIRQILLRVLWQKKVVCLYFKWNICMRFYACHPASWVQRSVVTWTNKGNGVKRINRKKVMLFPKVKHIDMAFLSQVFSTHTLTSLVSILQCINERHRSSCCLAAKHSKHIKLRITNKIREKPVNLFMVLNDRLR